MTLSLKEVQDRVELIQEIASGDIRAEEEIRLNEWAADILDDEWAYGGDGEACHILQDHLAAEVLKYIGTTPDINPMVAYLISKSAASVFDLKFNRWYS